MAVVRRIGPGSAFKIGLVLYAVLGLIVGICFALFSMLGGALTSMTGSPSASGAGFMFGFGIGAVIIFPIMYGIIGGVGAPLARWSTILWLVGWVDWKWTSVSRLSSLGLCRSRKQLAFWST